MTWLRDPSRDAPVQASDFGASWNVGESADMLPADRAAQLRLEFERESQLAIAYEDVCELSDRLSKLAVDVRRFDAGHTKECLVIVDRLRQSIATIAMEGSE